VANLTITDAARVAGVSRVTLHRYIKSEKLSRSVDGTIDTVELLRIGLVLQPDTVFQPVSLQHDVTSSATPSVTPPDPATLQHLITVLQRDLDAAHAREEAARECEALLVTDAVTDAAAEPASARHAPQCPAPGCTRT
jgi:hypothetical protein